MNLQSVLQAFWSWMNCVAETTAAVAARLRPPPRARLIEEEGDVFRLDLAPGSDESELARVRIVGGSVVGALDPRVAAALQGSRAELVLRPSRFLFRPLELPRQAAEFLAGIVRAQIDRLTPWTASEALFGWTQPTETGNDRLSMTVAATARSLVAPYVEALAGLGAKAIAVSTLPQGGDRADAPIKMLDEGATGALDVARVRNVLAAVFVLAGLSAAIATAVDQVVGDGLDAQRLELSRRISQHRALMRRDGIGSEPSARNALDRRKWETPSSVIVIEVLSQILPDHTYVTELRVEGDKLQLIGITHDAPSLIRLIEQSPHFTRATFFAPTTRSAGDPGERFHIEARIKPVFTART